MQDCSNQLKECEALFNTTERKQRELVWQDIARFILPGTAGRFIGDNLKGEKILRKVLSPMARQYNHDLATSMHSMVINPSSKWLSLKLNKASATDLEKEWLEEAVKRTYKSMYENKLDLQLAKNFLAYSALGNMVLFQEPVYKNGIYQKVRFEAIPLSEVAWSEDYEGNITTVVRRWELTREQLLDRWGDSVPREIKDKHNSPPDETFKVYQRVKKRKDKDVELNEMGLAPANKRPFLVEYLIEQGKAILEEDGAYENPYIVTRWNVNPGNVYGWGCGEVVIEAVKSYNQVLEYQYKRIALNTLPPILTTSGNRLTSAPLKPGTEIPLRNPRNYIPFQLAGNSSELHVNMQEMRDEIKACFFLDKLFLPPRTETGEMSAFEVNERLGQMFKVLGTVMARLHSELLEPLALNNFRLQAREGQLPPVPESLVDENLADLDISFINQLTKSQGSEDVSSVNSWIQALTMLAQINPEVMDIAEIDNAAKFLAEKFNVPEILITDEEKLQQIRENRAAQQQQQQQVEQSVAGADVISKLGL